MGPISLISTLPLGLAMLWAVRLAFGGRPEAAQDPLRLLLTIAGWMLTVVGLLGGVLQFPVLAWLFGPVILGVLSVSVARYRRLEWASLLWLVSSASARGIPLATAVRSFALERTDEVGARAALLADLLDSGVPFPDALDKSKTRLPNAGLLAARYGAETGDLGQAISCLVNSDDEVGISVQAAFEKCFYLMWVFMLVTAVLTAMNLMIIPVFSRMFDEFGIALPSVTRALIRVADGLAVFGPALGVLFACTVAGMAFVTLYYANWLPVSVPLLDGLTRRYDGSLIMRALGLGVRQGRSMNRVIWILSRTYPRRSVRRRLQAAGEQMNNGADWLQSLRRQRLIRSGDAAVFAAAQRVGNLEWALRETADAVLRRVQYRITLWLNLLFPAALVGLALVVGVVVVGLFSPLIQLINSLA